MKVCESSLPSCMMPDGGDPCAAYQELYEKALKMEDALQKYIRAGCGTGTHFVNQRAALENAAELLQL